MVRLLESKIVPNTVEGQSVDMAWMKFCGTADVEKPTVAYKGILIANGSEFITIGGATYLYDEENQTWVEDGSGSGSVTMQDVLAAIQASAENNPALSRVISLDETPFMHETLVDAIGIPVYVSDVSDYSEYELTDTGWYVFARICANYGIEVAAGTTVEGCAGYIANVGSGYVDVAVKFEEAAISKTVVVTWDEDHVDRFTFRANDLAVRNLDYRSTFYLYPLDDYVTWSYERTTDTTFSADKKYYTESDGEYTLAEVTASAAVPPNYYEQNVSYAFTADETFQDGKTYYTESGGEYTAAEVTTGDAVTAETYYEQSISYTLTTDTEIQDGKTYYTLASGVYSEATVTAGDPIVVYYNHSKLTISGMTRNLTYELEDIVDCPTEVILPTITDGDNYGCWYDFQLRHAGTYSISFTLPEGVKFATNNTPNPTVGMNLMHVFYTDIGGAKVWGAMNTHVDFTA